MPPKHTPNPTKTDAASTSIPIVVVERNGDLRASSTNAYTPLELAKKCKFKTAAGFEIRTEWAYSGTGSGKDDRFIVELWAREDGNAGQENKYEFPPPVDTILFFGACALVAKDMTSQHNVIPLTLEKWDKMYNFLFGGFDSLVNCEDDDDDEEDELDAIPAHRKTKDGYLKDGFVVDNSSDDDDDSEGTSDETEDEDETEDDETEDAYDSDEETDDADANDEECSAPKSSVVKPRASKKREKKQPREEVLVDTSSELSEEAYEYFDD
jgi:hypothetical protein